MANECYNSLDITLPEGHTSFPEGFMSRVVDEQGNFINDQMYEGSCNYFKYSETHLEASYDSPWGPTQDWAAALSAAFPDVIIEIEYMEENMGLSGQLVYRGGETITDIEDKYIFVRKLMWGIPEDEFESEVEDLIDRLEDEDEEELTAILALPEINPKFLNELHTQLKSRKEEGDEELGETSINTLIKHVRSHPSYPVKAKKKQTASA
jgi:hypothetical protein